MLRHVIILRFFFANVYRILNMLVSNVALKRFNAHFAVEFQI